jgi:Putative metallopeptidase
MERPVKYVTFVRNHENKCLALLALALLLGFALACRLPDVDNNNGGGNDNKKKVDKKKGTNEQGNASAPDKGDFKVEHGDSQKYAELDKEVREKKILENAAEQLNQSLTLPYDMPIRSKECGVTNSFYDPGDRSLNMCFELMDFFYNLYKQQGKTEDESKQFMYDSITYVFCHELGHALADAYQLPVTGKEEDAVDQLASYISSEEMGPEGEKAAVAAAVGFYLSSQGRQGQALDNTVFADEHSMSEQRYYNILCWLYGHNPEKYKGIVDNGTLPEARAVRCPKEYEKLSMAWKTQLKPFRKRS